MRVVFFGTPEFAVPSLRALLERHEVAAVVTQPDKPRGRSRSTLVPPAVKAAALEHDLPVLQPERPSGDAFLSALRQAQPDIGAVVAYGHILRPEVLSLPRYGMVNVHASLLPRWRGAAPIPWAILAGDTVTGVSIMQMEAGLDTGPVLHRVTTPIGPDDTAGTLTARLAELGARALLEALDRLACGDVRPEPQNHAEATYAPKIDRDLTKLRFDDGATAVARKIRAFDPQPGAWATLRGTPVKLFGARVADRSGAPGTVLSVGPTLVIGCGGDAVEVREAQPAGRTRLTVEEWARGRGVAPGDVFA